MYNYRLTIGKRNGSTRYSIFSDEHGAVTLPYKSDVIDGSTGQVVFENNDHHDEIKVLDGSFDISKYGPDRAILTIGGAYHDIDSNYLFSIGDHVRIELDSRIQYDEAGALRDNNIPGMIWTGLVSDIEKNIGDTLTIVCKGAHYIFKGMEITKDYTFTNADVTSIFVRLLLDNVAQYFGGTTWYYNQNGLRSLLFDSSGVIIKKYEIKEGADLWGEFDRLAGLATNIDQTFVWGVYESRIEHQFSALDTLRISPYFFRAEDHTTASPVYAFSVGDNVRTLRRNQTERYILNRLRIYYSATGKHADFDDAASINSYAPFRRRVIHAGALSDIVDVEKIARAVFLLYSEPDFITEFEADLPTNVLFYGRRDGWGGSTDGTENFSIFPTIGVKYEKGRLTFGQLAQQFSTFSVNFATESPTIKFSFGKIPFPSESRGNGDTLPPREPPWIPPGDPPYIPPRIPPGTETPENPGGDPPIIIDYPEIPPEVDPPDVDTPGGPDTPVERITCISYSALINAFTELACTGSENLTNSTIGGYLTAIGIDWIDRDCSDIQQDLEDHKELIIANSGEDCMDAASGNGYDVGAITSTGAVPPWETDPDNTFGALIECTCPAPPDPPEPPKEPACIDMLKVANWVVLPDFLGLSPDAVLSDITIAHGYSQEEVSAAAWLACVIAATGIDTSQPAGVLIDAIDDLLDKTSDLTGSTCVCVEDVSGCDSTTLIPPSWPGSAGESFGTQAITDCNVFIDCGTMSVDLSVLPGSDPVPGGILEYYNLVFGAITPAPAGGTNAELFDQLFNTLRLSHPVTYLGRGPNDIGYDVSGLEYRLDFHPRFDPPNQQTFAFRYERKKP